MEPPIKQKFIIEVDGEGQIKAYNQDLKNNEKQTKKNTKANVGFSSSLGKVAVRFATLGTAVKASKIAWQLGELGARVQTVDKNFKNFARQGGMDSIKMMRDLRKASGGMMDDMFLQQQAMKGMISGIKFDDMIVAMEYVRKYALSTGDDVNAKMQTVMTGLARGSAQFMDDVGIQVIGSKDVVNDTINQMKEKMGQFADTSDDVSVAISDMKTEFSNLKQEIGSQLIPVVKELSGLLKDTAQGWRWLVKGQKEYENTIVLQKRYNEELKRYLGVKKNLEKHPTNPALVAGMDRATKELLKYKKILGDTITLPKELQSKTTSGGAGEDDVVGAGVGGEKSLKERKKLADKAYDAMVQERERIEMNNAIEIATMEQFAKNYANVMKDVQIAKTSAFGFGDTPLKTQEPSFTDDYQEQLTGLEEFVSEYGDILQSGMNSVSSIFSTMFQSRRDEISKTSNAEIEAVKRSARSEKDKAKAISAIEKKSQEERKKSAMAEWGLASSMALTNTFLAGTDVLAKQAGGAITKGVAFATITALGLGAVAQIASSKPRFYYGSKDSGGANYTTVGGNSQGDAIPALLRSNEMVINPSDAKKLMQGGSTTNSSNVTITAPITIHGSADTAVLEALPGVIVDTIQNAQYNGLFNSNYA